MKHQTMPPRRELPSNVRDRLRRRLWSELDRPTEPRRNRLRIPVFAAACAAAVLVAGSVVFAQNASQAPEQMQASMDLDPAPSAADAQLDRCHKAVYGIETSPLRALWTAAGSSTVDGTTLTAFRATGTPMFCETTERTVILNNPLADPGKAGTSKTSLLMATANGSVAGVVDPTWDSFQVRVTVAPDKVVTAEPVVADGLFVAHVNATVGPETRIEAVRGSAYTFSNVPMGTVMRKN
nr:hypothetical protein [Kibdelosporangium sp. MJ126-NF4]CEL22711.1 hypothetical protein [Kibdelosporangium sp. MJ126-NF4]CTQ89851.1 hypothetical protein [Kibdelosporangium sp. MJ126-NF4]